MLLDFRGIKATMKYLESLNKRLQFHIYSNPFLKYCATRGREENHKPLKIHSVDEFEKRNFICNLQ